MRFNWGTGILIFFIIFLILAFTFIVFSFRQNNDLVTDDYYEQGADYSTQIEVNKRSHVYTDSISISSSGAVLQVSMAESLKQLTDSMSVHFYYPKGKENDVMLSYTKFDESITVDKNLLTSGRTIVKVNWFMRGQKYYLEKIIYID